MALYLVERFLPALTREGVRAQAERERAAASASTEAGVRFIRATYLRDDELCFSIFEAPSIDAVRRCNERASLAYERITEAIDVGAERTPA